MNSEQLKEKIKLNTEMFKAFVAIAVIIVGSTISLSISGVYDTIHSILVIIGSISSVVFISLAIFVYIRTDNFINKL